MRRVDVTLQNERQSTHIKERSKRRKWVTCGLFDAHVDRVKISFFWSSRHVRSGTLSRSSGVKYVYIRFCDFFFLFVAGPSLSRGGGTG